MQKKTKGHAPLLAIHLLSVSLFVLGLTGSLWTTVYALLLHQYERWEFLDGLIEEAVYDVVADEYVLPVLLARLRDWAEQEDRKRGADHADAPKDEDDRLGAYARMRLALQLDADEMQAFVDRSLEVVRLRRLWHRRAYVVRRIRETCNLYHWRIGAPLVDDVWEHCFGGGSA